MLQGANLGPDMLQEHVKEATQFAASGGEVRPGQASPKAPPPPPSPLPPPPPPEELDSDDEQDESEEAVAVRARVVEEEARRAKEQRDKAWELAWKKTEEWEAKNAAGGEESKPVPPGGAGGVTGSGTGTGGNASTGGIGGGSPPPHYELRERSEGMQLVVKLPANVSSLAQLELEVSAERVAVSVEGASYLQLSLPRPIDDSSARAKFLKKSGELKLEAPFGELV